MSPRNTSALLALLATLLLPGCGLINALSDPPEDVDPDVGFDDVGGDDVGDDPDVGSDVDPSIEIVSATATPLIADPGEMVALEVVAESEISAAELTYLWTAPAGWELQANDSAQVTVQAPVEFEVQATITIAVSHGGSGLVVDTVEVATRAAGGPAISALEATIAELSPGETFEVTVDADHPDDLELFFDWTLPQDWTLQGDDDGPTIVVDAPDEFDVEAEISVVVSDEFDREAAASVTVHTVPLFCGGAGTDGEPWLICSARALYQVGTYPQYWGDDFTMTDSVDLSEVEGEFPIIGDATSPFTGSFDGQGHTITGLSIDADHDDVGLFGRIAEGATVQHLILHDVDVRGETYVGALAGHTLGDLQEITISGTIHGSSYVGGLAGSNLGLIERSQSRADVEAVEDICGGLVGLNQGEIALSRATGTVTADGESVGGLAGENTAEILSSYADASVNGVTQIGGLVGHMHEEAWITDSYAMGELSGEDHVGGLVGYSGDETANVERSYWVVESTGHTTSRGGDPLETLEDLSNPRSFSDEWVFYPQSDGPWIFYPDDDGITRPFLQHFLSCDAAADCAFGLCDQSQAVCTLCDASVIDTFGSGTGTSDDPYGICNADQLRPVATEDSGAADTYFRLYSDITLDEPWTIDQAIGSEELGDESFAGTFDGNHHRIYSFTLHETNRDSVGLFRTISEDGAVKRLHLLSASIRGQDRVGILAGQSAGTITSVSVAGEIKARAFVGGMVGDLVGAQVADAHAEVNVEGTSGAGSVYLGGLVGRAYGLSMIIGSSAHGDLFGFGNVKGGLVGLLENSQIRNSFATGHVTTSSIAGGLVALIEIPESFTDPTVSASFATGNVTVQNHTAGGLVGYNRARIEDCFATGDVFIDDPSSTDSLGGLVSTNTDTGVIRNCYSTGTTSPEALENDAASVGANDGEIYTSFWDIQTSQMPVGVNHPNVDTSDIEPLETEDFATPDSFPGWDFDEIWGIADAPDGVVRPILRDGGVGD